MCKKFSKSYSKQTTTIKNNLNLNIKKSFKTQTDMKEYTICVIYIYMYISNSYPQTALTPDIRTEDGCVACKPDIVTCKNLKPKIRIHFDIKLNKFKNT